METPSDQAADLPARVAQWIAGGETYEVEFEGEQRERLNDRDLVEAVVCLPETLTVEIASRLRSAAAEADKCVSKSAGCAPFKAREQLAAGPGASGGR